MLKHITSILTGNTCKSVGSFLSDYVEGRLETKTKDRFDAHIDMCPNCRLYLDQYRATVSMVKEISPPPVPSELEERTCAFIHEALGTDPKSHS